MGKKFDWIRNELKNLRDNGLTIDVKVVESAPNALIKINGKKYINFSSNNYLGLANNLKLRKASQKAIDKYGVGPCAVRTIAGTTSLHIKLEKALTRFKKVEDVLVLQSGFIANLATIPALVGENDIIFSDELNHASIIDGCRLSKAKVIKYSHLNFKNLEDKIKTLNLSKQSKAKTLIVTDGVFSMDGDIAPLPNLVELAKKYDCLLMVDDAHGEGVLGKNGRGIVDHFKLHGKVDIEVGTLSKAFAVVGGYVAGKKIIIDLLKQHARPFLFSSALTSADTAAACTAVEILTRSDNLVKKLWENTFYFKEKLIQLGFDIGKSQTPIIPIMLGDVKLAKEFSKKLFDKGIFAIAIGFPTVAMDKARIRLIISAMHKRNDLEKTSKIFREVGKTFEVI
ncbi:glycine C-acetyltransferase [Candidatus Woesebacteria bacterium RIFCSPHIGHO2_01_FULL_38_10]|nr:MAG: glycine C-acetyltransferase [Candidatus Woesebacteria bacterium RIFCSPHIGHO2_01_FULL_38_10]